MRNIATRDNSELEALEQREWRESLDYVIQQGDRGACTGCCRRCAIMRAPRAWRLPFSAVTPYVNTIHAEEQTPLPGSQEIERRIKSLIRWNAMAMVVRANSASDGIGGHISTYASAATLYEVGFNHFFRGRDEDGDGDIIYFQGHASPGIYARAFLEGRLSGREAAQLPPRAGGRRRAVVVSASVADAGLLGVPDRLDGPRPDHGDLPGAVQSLPRRSRAEDSRRLARSGRFSATAKPTSRNRSARSRWRRAKSSTT